MYTKKNRGFTLIELLVVIAIIGILASVVLAGLGSQRERARVANAQQSLRSVVPTATICIDTPGTIQAPGAGNPICNPDNGDEWPTLPVGWSYGTTSSLTTEAFTFSGTGDGATISCSMTGCATSL